MKYIGIILLFVVTLFAQDKGYIDMHGGKKSPLTNNKSSFSNSFSNSPSLGIKKSNKKEFKNNSNNLKNMKNIKNIKKETKENNENL